MNINTYNSIITLIKKHHGLCKDCLPLLIENFPSINHATLRSIVNHEYRKRMRYRHIKTPDVIEKYYDLYTAALQRGDKPGIILKIAQQYDVTPCLVAKLILERHFCDGESAMGSDAEGTNHLKTKFYVRDTNLIPDKVLAYEVFLCTLYDDQYSPLMETMHMSIGQQYEIKLHNDLAKLGVTFQGEEHLRKYGYDKTPDVKLEVPIAIDGFIVNWMESKALFGDEDVHKEYMHNQYLSYWNRFGTGLVIYWFGFVESILQPNDKKFRIRDCLPTNIVQITVPKLLDRTENNVQ